MAYIGCDLLLELYARFYTWDGSQFNRQTGMVTLSKSWRHPALTAPFYEFDAQLQFNLVPRGGSDYLLWLEHRYTGRKLCLVGRIHHAGLTRQEALATWDSLQRYMDISQPLPDQPILEPSRHLDPTTAAHDLATQRPPRYWRDMNVKDWNHTLGNALREQVANYPWQIEPCLIRARTHPTLSVLDYYQSQESKGIHATSGNLPVDEVHG